MDPKLTAESQLFERFRAACTRDDFETSSNPLAQLKAMLIGFKNLPPLFKDTPFDDPLVPILKALTELNPSDDRDTGGDTVPASGSLSAIEWRRAAVYVGFSETTPNRWCVTDLQATQITLTSGLSRNSSEELTSNTSYDEHVPHFCNIIRYAVLKKDSAFTTLGGPWESVDGGDPSLVDDSSSLGTKKEVKDETSINGEFSMDTIDENDMKPEKIDNGGKASADKKDENDKKGQEELNVEKKKQDESTSTQTTGSAKARKKKIIRRIVKQKVANNSADAENSEGKQSDLQAENNVRASESSNVLGGQDNNVKTVKQYFWGAFANNITGIPLTVGVLLPISEIIYCGIKDFNGQVSTLHLEDKVDLKGEGIDRVLGESDEPPIPFKYKRRRKPGFAKAVTGIEWRKRVTTLTAPFSYCNVGYFPIIITTILLCLYVCAGHFSVSKVSINRGRMSREKAF